MFLLRVSRSCAETMNYLFCRANKHQIELSKVQSFDDFWRWQSGALSHTTWISIFMSLVMFYAFNLPRLHNHPAPAENTSTYVQVNTRLNGKRFYRIVEIPIMSRVRENPVAGKFLASNFKSIKRPQTEKKFRRRISQIYLHLLLRRSKSTKNSFPPPCRFTTGSNWKKN